MRNYFLFLEHHHHHLSTVIDCCGVVIFPSHFFYRFIGMIFRPFILEKDPPFIMEILSSAVLLFFSSKEKKMGKKGRVCVATPYSIVMAARIVFLYIQTGDDAFDPYQKKWRFCRGQRLIDAKKTNGAMATRPNLFVWEKKMKMFSSSSFFLPMRERKNRFLFQVTSDINTDPRCVHATSVVVEQGGDIFPL